MKPLGIYQKILKGIIEFPPFLTLRAKDLIRKLLNPQARFRLGVADEKFDEWFDISVRPMNFNEIPNFNGQSIRLHKWFKGVDWQMVQSRQVPSPWVPYLKSELDACWFDRIPDTPRNQNDPISKEEQLLFADF